MMSSGQSEFTFVAGILDAPARAAIERNGGRIITVENREHDHIQITFFLIVVYVSLALLEGSGARYTLQDKSIILLSHRPDLSQTVARLLT
jgi:hypothetical protein